MKSLKNKADVAQRKRIAQRQLSTDFLDYTLEWRRIFAETWGTFLLFFPLDSPRAANQVNRQMCGLRSSSNSFIHASCSIYDPRTASIRYQNSFWLPSVSRSFS